MPDSPEPVSALSLAAWLSRVFTDSASNPLHTGAALEIDGEIVSDLVISLADGPVGRYAFRGCGSLESVTFAPGVAAIGAHAFRGCEALEEVTFPTSMRQVGENAFRRCHSLETVNAPSLDMWLRLNFADGGSNPLLYGADLMIEGKPLVDLVIPGTLKTVGAHAFHGCGSLKNVTLEPGVTTVSAGAFRNCEGLRKVTLPEGLEAIGDLAFRNCEELRQIILPASLRLVGEGAFKGCSKLERMDVRGRRIPQGLQVKSSTALVGPGVTVAHADGRDIPLISAAKGCVIYGLENAEYSADQALRDYAHTHGAQLCRAFDYQVSALRWMVAQRLFSKTEATRLAMSCAAKGLLEQGAILMEVEADGSPVDNLEL